MDSPVLATADPHKESGATQAGAARVGDIGVSSDGTNRFACNRSIEVGVRASEEVT